jgi:hypothetical protein
MHFEDWDTVPHGLREAGLTAMIRRYSDVIAPGHRHWSRMSAADWDEVPQPIGAMAFIEMARHWTRRYAIGRPYGLSQSAMADTVAAIIMAESWFDHRGMYTNRDGSTDLGLGGSSAYCRRALRRLYAAGEVHFTVRDDEYFNPWDSSRVAAVWFRTMLDEADGDVDLAIAAYHVGITAAKEGRGAKYGASVKRKRRRYIRDDGAPPSWDFVFKHVLQNRRQPAAVAPVPSSTKTSAGPIAVPALST